jgi:glycine/D-amino acid oxidase-like deaminating enzyme
MKPDIDKPYTRVVWQDSAVAAPVLPPLDRSLSVDLCVIGGGFLGLSTALHAAEAGLSVAVLEAGEIGGGASGRNGGQVIPGLKHDPDDLVQHYGEKDGERLVSFAGSTADAVFDLIARHNLTVAHRRDGWIQAAHKPSTFHAAAARAEQWRRRGADVAVLDAAEMRRLTGATDYAGGWIDRRAGAVNPLSLARELARIAQAKGAMIATDTTVTELAAEGAGWRLATEQGHQVRAKQVMIATNAFSDRLFPGLDRSFVAVNSFQIATEPLSSNAAAHILPDGQVVSDTRRVLLYFRRTAEGRLMLGGRGPLGGRAARSALDWRLVEASLAELFPELGPVAISHRWFGPVSVTPDHLPHLHMPAPGLAAAVGCQGRGVGLQTALGGALGRYFAEGDPAALPFPVTPLRTIPFHGWRQIGIAAMTGWYRLVDAVA